MTVENLANQLGKPGRFQVLIYLMVSCNSMFVCWNHLGMAFMAAKTKHHCCVANGSDIDHLVPITAKDGKNVWDGCHLYAVKYNKTDKVSCENGWTYYHPGRERTIISEWDLVCDDAYKAPLAATIYFCGVLLGGLVFGPLCDKFGRRPVLLFTVFSPAVIGLIIYLSHESYVAFVVLRFILGFVLQGLQAATYIIIIELFPLKYRTTAGTAYATFWSYGVMSLALIAYVIQDWRYIQLLVTVITLSQFMLICFLPESFRWLFAKHRSEKAEHVVEKITRFNKLQFPREAFEEAVEDVEKNESKRPGNKYTIIDMFRFPQIRLRSIITAWLWFSTSVGYYGISLNISSLAGNKYINFFIGGVLEFVAYSMTVVVTKRFGRRNPQCLFLIAGGVLGIAAGVLSEKAGDNEVLGQLTTALAIIGKMGLAGSFGVIFIYTSELFPTVIRSVAFGACASWARFGGIIAPQILLLGNYTRRSVPFILFGCCAFVGGLAALFLPETLNQPLTDTIEETGVKTGKSSEEEQENVYVDEKVENTVL